MMTTDMHMSILLKADDVISIKKYNAVIQPYYRICLRIVDPIGIKTQQYAARSLMSDPKGVLQHADNYKLLLEIYLAVDERIKQLDLVKYSRKINA